MRMKLVLLVLLLVLTPILGACGYYEVVFPDANLDAAIREAIGKPDGAIYACDLKELVAFSACDREIADITGLEQCVNLKHIVLWNNRIEDIEPLASLTGLEKLYIGNNRIRDISPLASLTRLTELNLGINRIDDITPLSSLTSLLWLDVWDNQVTDVAPLASLTDLQVLYPHARIDLIEISATMSEIGEGLREWLGVSPGRVRWIIDDVLNATASGYDFVYLYRPVRPEGPGRDFYTRFAREVESEEPPPVIFSIADCLGDFLSDRYEIFYGDGHLTCFKPKDV